MVSESDYNDRKNQRTTSKKKNTQNKNPTNVLFKKSNWQTLGDILQVLTFFLCFGNTNIRALTICILPMTVMTFLVLNFKYLKLTCYFLHVYFIFLELEREFSEGRVSPRYNSSSTPFSTD